MVSVACAGTPITLSDDIPPLQIEERAAQCVDISGLSILARGGAPAFQMIIGERVGESNAFNAHYVFGTSDYSGSFSVESNYPILNETEDVLTLKGSLGMADMEVLGDSNFITWMGGFSNGSYVQLNSAIVLTLTINKNASSGCMVRVAQASCNLVQLPEQKEYDVIVSGQTPIFEALVPEPSTATLSLLALAGLCACRRRS